MEGQARHRRRGIRLGRRLGIECRADGEGEAGAEGMRAAQQAAEIHRLADALDADAKIAAHEGGACMGAFRAARCFGPASFTHSANSIPMASRQPPLIVEVTRGKEDPATISSKAAIAAMSRW